MGGDLARDRGRLALEGRVQDVEWESKIGAVRKKVVCYLVIVNVLFPTKLQYNHNRALSDSSIPSLLCGKDFLAVIGVLGVFWAAAPDVPALGAFFPTVGRAVTSARDVEGPAPPPPPVRLPPVAAVTLMLLFVIKPDEDDDDEEFAS